MHACHQCRDLVEREGWVKTRLAGLSCDTACAPSSLKGSLLSSLTAGLTPGDLYLASEPDPRPRRVSLVVLGGGAAGAAVMGVLALGAAPADAPTVGPSRAGDLDHLAGPAGLGVHNRRPVPRPDLG